MTIYKASALNFEFFDFVKETDRVTKDEVCGNAIPLPFREVILK